MNLNCGIFIIAISCFIAVKSEIELQPVRTVYVPVRYDPQEEYELDGGVGEQLALDSERPYIYTIGNNMIHIIDFSDPAQAVLLDYVTVFSNEGDYSITDVTVCGDWVAITMDNVVSPLEGKAMVYTRYDSSQYPRMTLLAEVIVGAVPDSSHFTSDCSKLVVVVEGEPRNIDGTFTDPEGGAGIITFDGNPGSDENPTFTFVNFNEFDNKEAEYTAKGVRKVYNGQGSGSTTTFSQDIEPENVAISKDDKYAYFTLQENNAFGVLDLQSLTWVDLYSMGNKSYFEGNSNGDQLDASDDDGGEINIQHWPIRAFYGADSIKVVQLGGADYLITANEGDTKEYDIELGLTEDWVEVERGETLLEDGLLSPDMSPDIVDMLDKDAQLGRLEFSMVDGLNSDGKIEELYAYGGRSVSIYRVSDMSLVYDTGSSLEQEYASSFPGVFNSNCRDQEDTPEQTMDGRSDNRGSEPEALESAVINNQTVIFVGLERPGLVAIYTITGVPGTPELNFESMYYGGGPLESGDSWEKLYDDRRVDFLEAEDLKVIPAERNSRGRPMLVVAGSVSGTVAFYDIIDSSVNTNRNAASTIEVSVSFLLLSSVLQLCFRLR